MTTKELILKTVRPEHFVFVLLGSMIPHTTEFSFVAIIDEKLLTNTACHLKRYIGKRNNETVKNISSILHTKQF